MFGKKKKRKDENHLNIVIGTHEAYSLEVKEYLEKNRTSFIERWGDICEKTHGRVSYDELYEILGRDFPRAPWIDKENRDANIRAFFAALGFPFKANETHIYFP